MEEQKKFKVEEDAIDQSTTNKKAKVLRKTKSEPAEESLEDVMQDLSSLITNNTKQEPEDTTPPEVVQKPKKYSKKQLDALKKKLLKKENIENTLKKMDSSTSNVIDMLDLNVRKLVSKPVKKRRHSIEKYPLETFGAPNIAQLTIFNNLPRSISPRAKRSSKIRQSVDNLSRRSSPYTTRSESPARILRNGKHRKLKDLNLLEGLDIQQYKRRRRLCSDFSGSELSVSKVSGYDSDSSFSDLSSLHGTESSDVKDVETKKEEVDGDIKNSPADSAAFQAVIKPNISNTPPKNGITENTDTNSNLYNDIKPPKDQKEPQGDNQIKDTIVDSAAAFEDLAVNPSLKVPEKSIILNIMKQTFNFTETTSEEANTDKDKRTTRASTRKSVKAAEDTTMTTPVETEESKTQPMIEEVKKEVVAENDQTDIEATTQETEANEIKQEPQKFESDEEKEAKDAEAKEEEQEHVTEMETAEIEASTLTLNKVEIVETPENLAIKENILQALGLRSLKAAAQAKIKEKERWTRNDSSSYTGTLKTVIKINRCEKKKGKNSLKMTLQKNKGRTSDGDACKSENESGYKIMKEVR